jgi:hypothetical protein
MNTKIIYSFVILAVAALTAWNVHLNSSKSELSDLSLANIEALAYELDEVSITCGQYYGQCWTMKPWGACVFTGDQNNWCF